MNLTHMLYFKVYIYSIFIREFKSALLTDSAESRCTYKIKHGFKSFAESGHNLVSRNCNSALSALAKFDSDVQVIPLPCLSNYHLWEYHSVTLTYRELMNTSWDSQLLFNHSSFMSWWNLCWYKGKIAQHWNAIVKTKLKVNEVTIKSRRSTEEKYEVMIAQIFERFHQKDQCKRIDKVFSSMVWHYNSFLCKSSIFSTNVPLNNLRIRAKLIYK